MATTASAQAAHSLKNIELFRDCSDDERHRVEQRCRWRKYQPSDAIIERAANSHEVHFITSGRVRVVDHTASGKEVSFDDIDAGGIIGEMAAIDGGERSASVIAVQPTVTGALDQRTFLNVLADHPDVALAMMQRLTRIVRQSGERIMELSTLGAHNRVHAEMLRLARRAAGDEAERARIYPIPVHADIASRVSTTRETVARVLSDLTKHGLVKRDGNALVIDDIPALEEMVERVRST
ncbi:Crp/Fnr family transcriptional regulator [Ferruginivarius sediminum]|uniref:Crp/Fnr family transcriptional regulator n=1 Tax=Ferruginivarius sediminum TaxID=2661937 RepID=A0A369T734_9PROT|nr:Crp/Fnr family transcriptional regulator [Ferruginivarius sediminum]RDD61130.1 Crp/Fnr family transcriptional regulator [Ferruginivarius sediminum]